MDPHGLCHDVCIVSSSPFSPHNKKLTENPDRFLLLAGRLADLYPAQYVFEGGFVTLAIFFLVSSFGKSFRRDSGLC